MKKIIFTWVFCLICVLNAFAQQTFPRNGAYDERPGRFAFTNATIVVDPQTTIEKGTLLIENGLIKEVGANVTIPKGTVITDLKGKFIYPSFLDLDSGYGLPEIKRERAGRGGRPDPQLESTKKGAFGWNQAIKAEDRSSLMFSVNTAQAEELRKAGFGTVLTHGHDGIVRGSGSLVSLSDLSANKSMLKTDVSAHFSFSKGASSQNYPSSPMGAVALLRQTYYDADWFEKGGKDSETNLSLAAFNEIKKLPSFFEATDKWDVLRADKIGDEFGIQYVIKGTGDEYQRVEEIKASGASLIIPLVFPDAFDVTDPWDADAVTVAELKHWELAPANASVLAKAAIPFSITSTGLKTKADFWPKLKIAVEYGLPKEKALEALTTTPAKLIKADNLVGSLKKGLLANFLITSGDLFGKEAVIYENWVQGQPYIITNIAAPDLRGTYDLIVGDKPQGKLKINGTLAKPEYQIMIQDTIKIIPKVTPANDLLTITYQPDKKVPGTIRLTGWVAGKNLAGNGELQDGTPVSWKATFTGEFKYIAKADSILVPKNLGKVMYPFTGYGWEEKPKQEILLIKNATIWTNEKEGILQNTDVLVQNGKITKVGKSLSAPTGGRTIDGTGKHLTNGIIDEHTHIALLSINEGAQSSSAEVRMSDVIDPDDVNIYRQLAGGVTAAQLLHGSANAIGGQSAVIKFKWGGNLSELLIPEAKYIKFALGENVKQANWGEAVKVRFPQSRMGVEQIYYDHFIRAKEYASSWKAYNSLKSKAGVTIPRRDLELDALVEILNDERFISCHSYVQSEINMLMSVSDSLKFRINTFTHILEGYKLADKMAARKIGGSTFSDWWAYKMEVKEAIAYNAALMAGEGVVVSINSDNAEMARRLNQEAAKTVAYGGVSEVEAWKMVTLNPAKLLHLDNRLGSIKPGMDGDLVLWNNNPLSVYARPEYTIIEGTVYFDKKADEAKQLAIIKEKARLVQKSIAAKATGSATQSPQARTPRMWECEDIVGMHAEESH